MVEKIIPMSRKVDLGRIRISTDELIKHLSKITNSPENIIVENGDYRLTGIDDIKAHQSLLHGNPLIKMGNIKIYFSSHNSSVDFDGYDGETDTGKIDSIAEFLNKYSKKDYSYLFNYIGTLSFLIFFTGYYFKDKNIIDPNIFLYSSIILSIGALVCLYKVINSPDWISVTYNPLDTFYKRNKDKIYFLAFGAVVSLVIKITYDYFTK